VTLDTTRADVIGPTSRFARSGQVPDTPAFNALAARGLNFRQAYTTVPETLPAHTSMMTGLYPAGHGVHENARNLRESYPVAAERLQKAGYRTAAFVSSFVLARRFGLARGFDVYDDELPGSAAERTSADTTDRAIAYLNTQLGHRLFLWVHYFDPHTPYAPPEEFRAKYANDPYRGEVAAMDRQLGRLVEAFERLGGPLAVVVVADHGEGLGDHGESQHGNLLYQSTMHVPLLIVAPGISPGAVDTPVSTRRVFHTLMNLAGIGSANSLLPSTDESPAEAVLGEAMKPFLGYGWQPQVMAIEGGRKAIFAGRLESYDVIDDPAEKHDLGAGSNLSASLRKALHDYPLPSAAASPAPEALSDEAKRKLASLGYVSAGTPPVARKDAPRPADMVHLFDLLEKASALFVAERYQDVIPLLEKILAADPNNLDAALRLATAHSSLGHDARAIEAFTRAGKIAPESPDVRMYLGLHYARGKDWRKGVPLLEAAVAADPARLPALEGLATIREREGHIEAALWLRQKIHSLRPPSAAELVHLGELAMAARESQIAVEAFESARAQQGEQFTHDLELGVLYLSLRRLDDAKTALDRVPPSHPRYPMALFKRAQVSVMLNEPDSGARIDRARKQADATTRELIAKERIFKK
jgi:arylsulfatase A-like enzyme/cytochrome c-type biogenesis protein CcmH/NrfG